MKNVDRRFGTYFAYRVNDDFKKVHLSGNLMRSIYVMTTYDETIVKIAPPSYDIAVYIKTGALYLDSSISYANFVDKYGSMIEYYYKGGIHQKHIGNHQNYVSKALVKTLEHYMKSKRYQVVGYQIKIKG